LPGAAHRENSLYYWSEKLPDSRPQR